MRVYVGHEKHDNPVYATPIAAVRARIGSIYQYEDAAVLETARDIVKSGDQERAWRFLRYRDDYEYEGITPEELIE